MATKAANAQAVDAAELLIANNVAGTITPVAFWALIVPIPSGTIGNGRPELMLSSGRRRVRTERDLSAQSWTTSARSPNQRPVAPPLSLA